MVREPGFIMDLMPTVLDLAGATYPGTEARHLEGEDILPMIEGKAGNADRVYCWEHEGHRAIRKGEWKLVMLPNSADGWELYDLSKDRIESHNLAEERPEIAKELEGEYEAWAKRCGVIDWKTLEKGKK
jgi:arylsulfatase